MNLVLRDSRRPEPKGATRYKLTYAELERMWDADVFPHHPDIELIDGEIYEMGADGALTRAWNGAVAHWLYGSINRDNFIVIPDKTLPLTEHNAPKPDFYVYPVTVPIADVTGANVSLVIEVSDSTLEDDRDLKGPLYELGGVRDYWIVDCQSRQILAFRRGEDGKYSEAKTIQADESIEALLIPGLALCLDELRVPD